jgi:hypothetical protein
MRSYVLQGETRIRRTGLSPFHGFDKVLVCRGVRSLGILATTPRQPLTHGFEGHADLTTGRGQGGTAAQRDADPHLHGHVQLRRSASRARLCGCANSAKSCLILTVTPRSAASHRSTHRRPRPRPAIWTSGRTQPETYGFALQENCPLVHEPDVDFLKGFSDRFSTQNNL